MSTTLHQLVYLVEGQAQKETTINTNADYTDASLNGYLTKSVAGSSNVTLTASEWRNRQFEFTGELTGNITVFVPATARLFSAFNNTTGSFSLTLRVVGSVGTAVVITQGSAVVLGSNGTNVKALFESASPASETVAGVAEIATQAETNAETDDARIVTPLKLATYLALVLADYVLTTTTINTNGPLTGGGDLSANRTLDINYATDTTDGSIELATQAEVNTGSDALRAVVPSTLAGATNVVHPTGAQTLTDKRITRRVVTVTDAVSITPNGDTTDLCVQINTQASGTLTFNAPTGTPTDGQQLEFRIKFTNSQTASFNAAYRDSTDLSLPTLFSAGTYRLGFEYNSTDSVWDFIAYAGVF